MVTSAHPPPHPTLPLYWLSVCRAQFISLEVSSSFNVSHLSSFSCAPCRPCESVQPRFSVRAIELNTWPLWLRSGTLMCVYSLVAAVGGGGDSELSVSASPPWVFQSGLFLFSVCVKNDSRPRVGGERLLHMPVHVCVQEDIYHVCIHYLWVFTGLLCRTLTTVKANHSSRQTSLHTVSKIAQSYQQSPQKSTSPIIDRLKLIILHWLIVLPSTAWRRRPLWRPRPLLSPAPSEHLSRVCPVFVRLVCCAKRAEFKNNKNNN